MAHATFTEPAPNNPIRFTIHIHYYYSLSPYGSDYNFSTDSNLEEEEEILIKSQTQRPWISILQYIRRSHNRVVQIPHIQRVEEAIIINWLNEGARCCCCSKTRHSGGIQHVNDLVQRLQPVTQLTHLSPKHRVLSLNA